MQTRFAKVSEWIKAGNMASGLHLLGCEAAEIKETEKAFGFPCKRFNACANLKPAVCWFPKSKVSRVEDDFYTHKVEVSLLVPDWLMRAKAAEGFEI